MVEAGVWGWGASRPGRPGDLHGVKAQGPAELHLEGLGALGRLRPPSQQLPPLALPGRRRHRRRRRRRRRGVGGGVGGGAAERGKDGLEGHAVHVRALVDVDEGEEGGEQVWAAGGGGAALIGPGASQGAEPLELALGEGQNLADCEGGHLSAQIKLRQRPENLCRSFLRFMQIVELSRCFSVRGTGFLPVLPRAQQSTLHFNNVDRSCRRPPTAELDNIVIVSSTTGKLDATESK